MQKSPYERFALFYSALNFYLPIISALSRVKSNVSGVWTFVCTIQHGRTYTCTYMYKQYI